MLLDVFTRRIQIQIDIQAPVDVVWRIVSDFGSYDQWNPFILKAEGDPIVGRMVPITIQLPGQKPGRYHVRILECQAPHRLRWLGHFIMPGLNNGTHVFELEQTGPDQTRLTHGERFQGLLVPMIWPSLGPRFVQAFESVNAAIKKRAEGR